MASNDNGDQTLDYYGNQGQQQTQAASNSWLPAGATLNGDGSITMPDGHVVAGPPEGYQRDPNTGVISRIPGNTSNQTQGALDPYKPPPGDPDQTVTGGTTSSTTSGNTGKGLFDPSLYAAFTGKAPNYQNLTLPGLPTQAKPPPFSYKEFAAPTLEEASKQPGYQFGLQQGEQALQQSRAAQGLLRTGGTLKDILDYGRNAATQNYSNVLNQDLGIYNTNRAGAVQEYNTNYKTQYEDQYAPQLLQYQTQAAAAQHENDSQNNRAWQEYLNSQDVFYNNENAPFSKYLSLAQLGAANA